MKINAGANAPQSSFGIPPEMQEAASKQKEAKERAERSSGEGQPGPEMSEDEGYEAEEVVPPEMDLSKSLDDLGIELTDNDLHSLLFKGMLEKEVVVVKSRLKDMTVRFKTLTGEEMQIADSLLSEDAESLKMTHSGFDSRKSVWILSFGIIRMNGQELAPVVLKEGEKGKQEIDLRETGKLRNKILHQMSPMLLDKMAKVHARITMACDHVMGDPSSPLLKRPSETQNS